MAAAMEVAGAAALAAVLALVLGAAPVAAGTAAMRSQRGRRRCLCCELVRNSPGLREIRHELPEVNHGGLRRRGATIGVVVVVEHLLRCKHEHK